MTPWIDRLYRNPDMLEMGHLQRLEDANLGLGWLYYGLVRIIRPQCSVIIGSWRGFTPIVLAKAMQDNSEGGRVVFIDPSFVDDFWKDQARVSQHFRSFGVDNIDHFQMTTEEFTATSEYAALKEIGFLFVDGFHDATHAKIDHETFRHKLSRNAVTVFHDSVRAFVTELYGKDKSYAHDVFLYMQELQENPSLQVFDLPFACGVTLVRETMDPDDAAFSPFIRRVDGTTNISTREGA